METLTVSPHAFVQHLPQYVKAQGLVNLDDLYEDMQTELGRGASGSVRLMKDKQTGQQVAVKLIPVDRVTVHTEREVIVHRQLQHPCVVRFQKVLLTRSHLVITMEALPCGTLMKFVDKRLLTEAQARYLFQQLVAAVEFCHSQGACHRDLKLENILVATTNPPELKLGDFGFTKSSVMHSAEKTALGTSIYAAPEVLKMGNVAAYPDRYDGKIADVWSLGVILGALLFHTYPFADPKDPKNICLIFERIMSGRFHIPENVKLSDSCKDLLNKIFQVEPSKRITVAGIREHEWFRTHLPARLYQPYQPDPRSGSLQPLEEVVNILKQARACAPPSPGRGF